MGHVRTQGRIVFRRYIMLSIPQISPQDCVAAPQRLWEQLIDVEHLHDMYTVEKGRVTASKSHMDSPNERKDISKYLYTLNRRRSLNPQYPEQQTALSCSQCECLLLSLNLFNASSTERNISPCVSSFSLLRPPASTAHLPLRACP